MNWLVAFATDLNGAGTYTAIGTLGPYYIEGLDHSITGLTNTTLVSLSLGTISNVHLVDVNNANLVYWNQGIVQTRPSPRGPTLQIIARGLVTLNDGVVQASYAGVNITTYSDEMSGGLVGDNNGTIVNSYATGSVTYAGGSPSLLPQAIAMAGGLVGLNGGVIENSYATGAVYAPYAAFVGGLIGDKRWLC